MASYFWTGVTDGLWDTAGNWTPSGPPGGGDSAEFDHRAVRSMTGSPTGTPTLASVRIRASMPRNIHIGTPTSPIAVGITSLVIGEDAPGTSGAAGSAQVCINLGSVQNATRIIRGAITGIGGLPAIQIKGTHNSNVLRTEGPCSVGYGVSQPADTYVIATTSINGGSVTLGSGGTLTTINQNGGTAVVNAAFTTLNQQGGTMRTEGTGAITTVNAAGTFIGNSTGTITTLNVKDGGVADFSKNPAGRTVTTTNLYGKSSRINAACGVALGITFTNGIDCRDGATSYQVNFGTDVNVAQAAL